MNRVLRFLTALNVLAIIPLAYFYYRDSIKTDVAGVNVETCVPYNLEFSNITQNEILVEWKTVGDCVSYLRYGLSLEDDGQIVTGEDGYLPSSSHKVLVEELKPSSSYYIYVVSVGEKYGDEGEPYYISTEAF